MIELVLGHLLPQDANYEMASKLLQEMRSSGIEPNNISFNSAIYACGQRRESQLALDLIDEMRGAGLSVRALIRRSCYKHNRGSTPPSDSGGHTVLVGFECHLFALSTPKAMRENLRRTIRV